MDILDDTRPFGMEEYYEIGCKSSVSRTDEVSSNPLNREVGGEHYKSAYKPIELMEKVKMYATCSYILKYVFRHKDKGKKQDLEKALHCCELMETLGMNWYEGTCVYSYDKDKSLDEFNKFVQVNKQLDANQIRAIFAICAKDINSLKMLINMEIKEFYS